MTQEEKAKDWYNSTKYKSNLSGTPIAGYLAGYKQAIEDAAKWWATVPDDTYYHNPCAGFVNRFKKEMNEGL